MTPLGERIAEMIASEGPISVEQYFELCAKAYYASRDPFGRAGDFTTAPEISQMFGELVAIWIADLVARAGRPAFDLVELGPGRGTLMADMLCTLRRAGIAPRSLHLVEASPALREAQRKAVPEAVWHDDLASLPGDVALVVVANEFFDALPVQQHVMAGGKWIVRRICLDHDALAFTPEGSAIRETSPARSYFAASLGQRIAAQGGAALIVDYGYAGDVASIGDSLQAVKAHEPVDPLAFPGESDITAHVDFTALAGAPGAGVRVHPLTTQGAFLGALGIAARAERLALGLDAEGRHAIASAMRRLTAPQAMGEVFKVLAFTHPEWPLPAGFAG